MLRRIQRRSRELVVFSKPECGWKPTKRTATPFYFDVLRKSRLDAGHRSLKRSRYRWARNNLEMQAKEKLISVQKISTLTLNGDDPLLNSMRS